jgi:hypothetical protein
VSLRTYPLIVHPAFIAFVEHERGIDHGLYGISPTEVPTHPPQLRDVSDIAAYLDVSPFFLRSMLIRPSHHYRSFEFKKRSGGIRTIHSPRTYLKVVQWWILDTILYNKRVAPCVHGFVPYKSFVTNAHEHVGARHMLNVDIEDFFPSITIDRVQSVFEAFGYDTNVCMGLARLTTLGGTLPQGAPTSPMIANHLLTDFDARMMDYCDPRGLIYTRYADDISISSEARIDADILEYIKLLLASIGLQLNGSKTRFMGPNARKEVTGLVLGKDGARLPKDYLNGCRGWFHRIILNPEQHASEFERVRGTLSLISQVGGAGSQSVANLGKAAVAQLRPFNAIG